NKIFSEKRFCHFFINSKAGLLEIRGSTIHSGSDPERKGSYRGYFFAARLWGKEYVAELSELVGGDIQISDTRLEIPNTKALLRANSIIFSRELLSWKGDTEEYIYIKIRSEQLAGYKLLSRNAVLIFIIFLVAVIIFITVFITSSVNMPLVVISQSLKKEDPEKLGRLEKETSEFGDIARLITSFFWQRQVLLKEVTERKKAEDELKKAYTELKETQDQLIQAEKLNAVGQLASGVAHEVRNPLGIILQGINYLERKTPAKEDETVEIITMLKSSVQRADKIINSLLDFARAASSDLKPEDINSILESSLGLVKARFKFDNIDVVLEIKQGMPRVLADKNKLEQVFINVLLNAAQAMPGGGKIIIRSYAEELKEARDGIGRREEDHFRIGEKAVIVEIEDSGSGISEENLKKIFDPFFTTKSPGSGVGLGLSVTRNIIHMHKGLIYAESQLGKGTKVIIILKIVER
ncbi:MAG: ATP-binding protein, partial [Candidatus Omnitrophica bacterium]|nr:ATP-binding protein [Candidatus Omnitrophota bacterium]